MSTTLTIRIDDALAEKLEHVVKTSDRTCGDIIRGAGRRQLAIAMLEEVREELVPMAEEKGIYTDEDVFREPS